MKILVVEDNADSRKLLVKQLRSTGHEVKDAVNGKEALAKALSDPPDMVVTDILMPVMDGFQLCIEWKQNDVLKNIPLVFYSATYTSDEDEQFAQVVGADAFIRKPTDPDVFLRILFEVVKKAGSGNLNRPKINPPQQLDYLMDHNKILLTKLNNKVAQLEMEVRQRQQAEKTLKESEEKYASLVNHGNDSIVIIEEGKIQYANPKMFETTGYTAEEAIGKPFILFVSPEYRDLVKERYQRRIAGEDVSATYELDIVSKAGKIINVELNASLIQKEKTNVEMAIIRDTTERKRFEEALRQSEEKFRQFFENAQVYCYIVSPEGKILEANNFACKMLGYTKEELTDKPLSELYAPESQAKASEIFHTRNETGIGESEELVILSKSGQRRVVLLSTGAIRNSDGEVVSSVSVQKDITELKQSRVKAQQVETLTQLNKAKSELLSNVSHELRTPLASIKGFIETLIEPDVKWGKKQQMEFLMEADKEVDILNSLIRDLLDVSRLESGKMKLDKQMCRLEEILESSKARLILLTANHILEVRLPPGLPPINVDKMRIAQVITNLVENATKFSPAGSPITIDAQARENQIIVRVTDKGIGMTEETLKKLFNRFYQAEQVVSGKAKGSGLGLSICRGIVEAHDGEIGVTSEPGKGSTFTFSLPI
jgi:PAS domain S-box-containing protein